MTEQYDFKTIFQLLDQMESCVNRVRELNKNLDGSLNAIPKAA
jgi:hypothetical protein